MDGKDTCATRNLGGLGLIGSLCYIPYGSCLGSPSRLVLLLLAAFLLLCSNALCAQRANRFPGCFKACNDHAGICI